MKLVQKRSKKTGLPPGTLVHIGEKKTDKVTITVFNYAGIRCDEHQDISLDTLAPPTDESVTWVNIGGIHKMDILESLDHLEQQDGTKSQPNSTTHTDRTRYYRGVA